MILYTKDESVKYKNEQYCILNEVSLNKLSSNLKLICIKINDEWDNLISKELKDFKGDHLSLLTNEQFKDYAEKMQDIVKANKEVFMLNQEFILMNGKLHLANERLKNTDLEREIKVIAKEINLIQKELEAKQKQVNDAFTKEDNSKILDLQSSNFKLIFENLKEKYKEQIQIDIIKELIVRRDLSEDLIKLIESENTSEFWINQDSEELAKAYDYFHRNRVSTKS